MIALENMPSTEGFDLKAIDFHVELGYQFFWQ